ncbi:MaoC-like dehydratase [Brucella ceti TE28753-12]|nr:MaoC-like dehydratase [Brucella ceti TE28753-12]
MSFIEENIGKERVLGTYTFTAEEIMLSPANMIRNPSISTRRLQRTVSSAGFALRAGIPRQSS